MPSESLSLILTAKWGGPGPLRPVRQQSLLPAPSSQLPSSPAETTGCRSGWRWLVVLLLSSKRISVGLGFFLWFHVLTGTLQIQREFTEPQHSRAGDASSGPDPSPHPPVA